MVKKKESKTELENKYERVNTADLIPYARNARKHSDEQVAKIAGSIKEFGFLNPVLIDKDNGIIAGHGRVMAAFKLEMATVPCLRVEHLTERQKKAYILADNKLAEFASWDDELLRNELEELKELDFDLEVIGFEDFKVEEFMPNLPDENGNKDSKNDVFKLIVMFENADEQQLLFNELNDRGLKVKV